jgi:hypothetical protein
MSTTVNYARNLRKVYVFDGRENPLGEYETVTACAEALNVKRQAVTMAASRGSILDKTYYVSYKEKFVRQRKKKEFNPLRPSVRAPRQAESKTVAPPVVKASAPPVEKILPAPAPSKAKPVLKRSQLQAMRSRSALFCLDAGFSPFNAFH